MAAPPKSSCNYNLLPGESQELPGSFIEQVFVDNRMWWKIILKDIVLEKIPNALVGVFFHAADFFTVV